jgi:hypothetical protein
VTKTIKSGSNALEVEVKKAQGSERRGPVGTGGGSNRRGGTQASAVEAGTSQAPAGTGLLGPVRVLAQ